MKPFEIKTWRYLFAAMCCVFLTSTAISGPPYQTDDPEPVAFGEHELYVAFEQIRTRDGTVGNLPSLELNYGAAPDLQIGVAVPYAFNNPRQDASHHGIGDIELGAKYRFAQESQNHPMMSFYPSVVVPLGNADDALGNGKAQLFLPVWLQKNWADWQSNIGGGYWINHATDARNHWFFGWQLQRRINDSWTLGGEIFHSTEEARSEGSSSGFNFGAVYTVDEHNHLLFSAGRGLSNVALTNQFSSYIGYQFNW